MDRPDAAQHLMVDDLADMFPGAQFVPMVRGGRRVVNSMIHFLGKFDGRPEGREHVPKWASDFPEACRTWRLGRNGPRLLHPEPDRGTTVVNERLSASPETGFAELYDFLGLEWEDGPVKAYMGGRVNSSFAGAAGRLRPPTLSQSGHPSDAPCSSKSRDMMLALGLAGPSEIEAWELGEPGGR